MIVNSQIDFCEDQFFKVPNVIIDDYVTEGGSVYLMIYLFALRQLYAGNLSISNTQIAQRLKINSMDVINAFMFYSSKGLIKIHNFVSVDDVDFDIEFCFQTNKTIKSPVDFRPNYKCSEIAKQLKDNPKVSQMYKMVSQMMGKNLSSADTELLYSLYDFYTLPIEVICVLVEYYVSKGKKSMRYIEKEAEKWAQAGIDTVTKAREHIKRREALLSYAYKVRNTLGIGERSFTAKELEFVNKWQSSYKMELDMVKHAYEITVNQTGKLSFAYMNKILESWAQNSITTKEGLIADKKSVPKNVPKDSRYDFAEIEKRAFKKVQDSGNGGVNNGV